MIRHAPRAPLLSLRDAMRHAYPLTDYRPMALTLGVYIDDSFEAGGGVYTLAGYFGDVDVFDKQLAPAWNRVVEGAPHKISEFKASDCRQGRGEFDAAHGWTQKERNDLTKEIVSVLETSVPPNCIHAVSIAYVHRNRRFPPGDIRWMADENGFNGCLRNLIADIHAAYDAKNGKYDEVQVVIDDKPGFNQFVTREMDILRSGQGPTISRLLPPLFADSKRVPALQLADLFAYETRKEAISRLDGSNRPVSKALLRLSKSHPHVARCTVSYQTLMMELMKAAGMTFEQVRAIPRYMNAILPMPMFDGKEPWRHQSEWPYCMSSEMLKEYLRGRQ